MPNQAARQLILELREAGPAPSGTITQPDGTDATFEGWLQLVSALTDAFERIGHDDQAKPAPGEPRPPR